MCPVSFFFQSSPEKNVDTVAVQKPFSLSLPFKSKDEGKKDSITADCPPRKKISLSTFSSLGISRGASLALGRSCRRRRRRRRRRRSLPGNDELGKKGLRRKKTVTCFMKKTCSLIWFVDSGSIWKEGENEGRSKIGMEAPLPPLNTFSLPTTTSTASVTPPRKGKGGGGERKEDLLVVVGESRRLISRIVVVVVGPFLASFSGAVSPRRSHISPLSPRKRKRRENQTSKIEGGRAKRGGRGGGFDVAVNRKILPRDKKGRRKKSSF